MQYGYLKNSCFAFFLLLIRDSKKKTFARAHMASGIRLAHGVFLSVCSTGYKYLNRC